MRADVQSTLDIFVEKGRKEGLQEGHLKGRREEREKAVRNMIREGFETEVICKIQEVTPEYVTRIRREMEAGK